MPGHARVGRRAARRRSAGTRRASPAASASAAASGCARTRRRCDHAQVDGTTRTDARGRHRRSSPTARSGRWRAAQVVPVTAVVPMPDGVPPEVAALIGCGVSTGVGAVIKTAAVPPARRVADHRARRRRAVVRDGRRARGRVADRRGGHEPGQARPRPGARRDGRRCSRIRPTRRGTVAAITEAAGDGGPEYVFEAIGLPATIGAGGRVRCRPAGRPCSSGCTPVRGGGVVRGLPVRRRRRAGSSAPTTGRRSPAVDFPRYAECVPRRASCRSTG